MPDFTKSVFVNCPFDQDYRDLLRPLIFTILYLGFHPRLAYERADSGETRLSKIIDLIEQSKFAIHDISRCKASKKGELFRLNMPLELGLDMGCKLFKQGVWKEKKILVIETEKYRYQAAMSDLSGADIKAHKNDPELIVKIVRDWLVQEASARVDPASKIHGAFLDFMACDYTRLVAAGWRSEEIQALPINELRHNMENWLREQAEA